MINILSWPGLIPVTSTITAPGRVTPERSKIPDACVSGFIGPAMVVDAHGAALYLLDKSKDNLVSEYQSEACPMLIPVPSHIAEQSEKVPNTINSYRRLTSIGKDWGPFGEALRTRKLLNIQNIGTNPHFKNADKKIHYGVSTIIAPLCYGDKELGILAVANEAGGENFTENDFEVFESKIRGRIFGLESVVYSTACKQQFTASKMEMKELLGKVKTHFR